MSKDGGERMEEEPVHDSSVDRSNVVRSVTERLRLRLPTSNPTREIPNNKRMLLEERVRLNENALKILLERRVQLSTDLEPIRLRRQKCMERKVLLRQRKLELRASRIRHLTLQKELKESLAKSRERLVRLTSLEEQEHGLMESRDMLLPDVGGDDASVVVEMEGTSVEAAATLVVPEDCYIDSGEHFQSVDATDAEVAAGDHTLNHSPQIANCTPRNHLLESFSRRTDIHTLEVLEDFNKHHCHPRTLMNFLPGLKSDQLEKILVMSIREAKALDVRDHSSRRCLLWNTCLDFCLLSRTTLPSARYPANPEAELGDEETELVATTLDPNVMLCPYELAGVCADKLCPFQHTSKETLSRERLPLPALTLPTSTDKLKVLQAQLKRLARQKKKSASASLEPSEEAAVENIGVETSSKGDFVSLPEHDPEVKNEAEDDFLVLPDADSEDEENHITDHLDASTSTAKDGLAMESEDLPKGTTLWWGGVLCGKTVSVDKMLTSWVDTEFSTSQLTLNSTRSLGCVIDMTRLAVHTGRFDVGLALLNVFSKEKNFPNWCQDASKLLSRATKSSFMYQGLPYSLWHSAFGTQATLAILSEYVGAVKRTSDKGRGLSRKQPAFHPMAMDCGAIILSSVDCVAVSLEDLIPDFREMIAGFTSDGRRLDLSQGLRWVKHAFHPKSPCLDSTHRIENDVLKPCWSIISSRISSLKDEERSWEGLRVVLLTGHMVLGCLERFASHVHNDTLTPSLTAALITVDATVSQMLKGLAKELSDLPLIGLLLAPLFASSVATATFLRLYLVAYHRFEGLLALKVTPERDCLGMTACSELLWSQFVHLRMALPVQVSEDQVASNTGHTDRAASKQYPWEPYSKDGELDMRLLLNKIEAIGVSLHHVTLEGDWVLAHATSNKKLPSFAQFDEVEAHALQKAASRILSGIFSPLVSRPMSTPAAPSDSALQLRNVHLSPRSDGRGRSPSPFISTLPRSLLIAGPTIQSLRLARCHLTILPATFGQHFPNLISLNLSGNQLTALPLSFREMIALERLIVCSNQLQELSGDELMASLKVLDISHNCLTTLSSSDSNHESSSSLSSPSPSLLIESVSRRCFQLEECNISYNHFVGSSWTLLEYVAVPQWSMQLKHLRILQWKPQRPLPELDAVMDATSDADADVAVVPRSSNGDSGDVI